MTNGQFQIINSQLLESQDEIQAKLIDLDGQFDENEENEALEHLLDLYSNLVAICT